MRYLGAQPTSTSLNQGALANDFVTEAMMANDAIGLPELKSGTDGELITWDSSGNPTAVAVGTSGHFLKSQGAGNVPVFAEVSAGGGKLVQIVSSVDGAVATGTTVFNVDNTIPQNTEGTEFMTLAITPTDASNKLVIQFTGSFAVADGGGAGVGSALFQDSTANALAAVTHDSNGNHERYQHTIQHVMAAGTTSSTTFKIRAGYVAGSPYTVTFNGSNGNRDFGGVNASSIIIWEYDV